MLIANDKIASSAILLYKAFNLIFNICVSSDHQQSFWGPPAQIKDRKIYQKASKFWLTGSF